MFAEIVVICFHFSIFESLETTPKHTRSAENTLWFAFILVSLNHWRQQDFPFPLQNLVVICFHFSIFESLETTIDCLIICFEQLWFAFILVSLNHWRQHDCSYSLFISGLGWVLEKRICCFSNNKEDVSKWCILFFVI